MNGLVELINTFGGDRSLGYLVDRFLYFFCLLRLVMSCATQMTEFGLQR